MDEEVATEGTTTGFLLLLLLVNDDDDVEELAVLAIEEVDDGVRLISVNKSFRPLRKYS